jgi:hypothetical protein
MILKKILLEARIMIMALAVVGLITTLTGVYGQEEGIDASRILSPGREGGPSSGTTGPIGGGTINPSPGGGPSSGTTGPIGGGDNKSLS